jgi:hypothetical protein
MANVLSYEKITLPDGSPGTRIHYDNGAVEIVDANNDRVGSAGYAGATPLAGLPITAAPMGGMSQRMPRMPAPQSAPQQPMGGASSPAPTPEAQAYDLSSGWSNLGSRMPAQPASQGAAPVQYGGGGGGNPFSAATPSAGFGYSPSYQDGSQHPLQGGAPRTPGGTYRGPSGGVDGGTGQQQVFVPGGAAAGPYDTSAASPPHGKRAFDASGRAYATKGDHRSPLYDKFSAKGNAMESKVRGMAARVQGMGSAGGGGASGGTSSSYGGGGDAAYARQQHQYTKDARQQQRAYEDGSYLYDSYKMRGFSKKMDPQQAEALMFRPSMLLPKVAKGLAPTSPRYGDLVDLPAAQLSMLRYGANGKAKDGPSQFTNNLAKFYEQAAGSGDLPSYDQLTSNLATAKRKSPLGAMFNKQPLGYGADNYESMVTSIFGSTGLDPRIAAARTETTQGLIDQYGSQMLTKKAKKATPINRWIAKRSEFL